MPKKQKPQFSNKKILLLTVCVLLLGAIMLIASILLTPSPDGEAKSAKKEKTAAEQPVQTEEKVSVASENEAESTVKPVEKQAEPEKKAEPAKPAEPEKKAEPAKTSEPEKTAEPEKKVEPAKPSEPPKKQLKKGSGKIAFVFDDAGHNITQLTPFLQLPFPATVAVLPQLAHSADAADATRATKNKELILHQPMQAVNLSTDPGPGAVTPDMTPSEIRALIRANIAEVGPVKGVNNHEGSFITADEMKIGPVLDVCLDEGIWFLDSRTNSATVVPDAAKARGMKLYERDIFLDNSQERADIIAMVEQGLSIADKKGYVIMIGHVWSKELASILSGLYPELVERGYTFSTVSDLW